jgi:hypothetical protein
MKFRMRKTIPLGPIKLHFTEHGYSSWSFKLGPFTWNSRTKKKRFDTPGPGSVEW